MTVDSPRPHGDALLQDIKVELGSSDPDPHGNLEPFLARALPLSLPDWVPERSGWGGCYNEVKERPPYTASVLHPGSHRITQMFDKAPATAAAADQEEETSPRSTVREQVLAALERRGCDWLRVGVYLMAVRWSSEQPQNGYPSVHVVVRHKALSLGEAKNVVLDLCAVPSRADLLNDTGVTLVEEFDRPEEYMGFEEHIAHDAYSDVPPIGTSIGMGKKNGSGSLSCYMRLKVDDEEKFVAMTCAHVLTNRKDIVLPGMIPTASDHGEDDDWTVYVPSYPDHLAWIKQLGPEPQPLNSSGKLNNVFGRLLCTSGKGRLSGTGRLLDWALVELDETRYQESRRLGNVAPTSSLSWMQRNCLQDKCRLSTAAVATLQDPASRQPAHVPLSEKTLKARADGELPHYAWGNQTEFPWESMDHPLYRAHGSRRANAEAYSEARRYTSRCSDSWCITAYLNAVDEECRVVIPTDRGDVAVQSREMTLVPNHRRRIAIGVTDHGDSGALVFSAEGDVAGLLWGGAQHVAYFTPIETVLEDVMEVLRNQAFPGRKIELSLLGSAYAGIITEQS